MSFRLITQVGLDAHLASANTKVPLAYQQAIVPEIEGILEDYVGRKLDYAEGIVEWFDPKGDDVLLLDQTPVAAVTEVRMDQQGGFGQVAGSFGTDTILTAGTDYYLDLDGRGKLRGQGESGFLYKAAGNWGYRVSGRRGLLAQSASQTRGTIKVTYNGGYVLSDDPALNTMPGIVSMAIGQLLCVWYESLTNLGIMTSESLPNYSWSQILGAYLADNQFTKVSQALDRIKRRKVDYR